MDAANPPVDYSDLKAVVFNGTGSVPSGRDQATWMKDPAVRRVISPTGMEGWVQILLRKPVRL